MIKAIIFDLWGTLLKSRLQPDYIARLHRIIAPELSYNEFLEKFSRVFMTMHFDDEKRAVEAICNNFNIDFTMELMKKIIGLLDQSNESTKPYDDIIELEKLKQIYKTALLCNTESFSLNAIKKNLNLNLFDFNKY